MASKNISFDSIPSSIRKPGKYFEFNTKLAVRSLPNNKQSMLIVGQRLAGGTVAALTPAQVFSDSDAAGKFGYGSMVHAMAASAIRANPYLDLTVCALDDEVAGLASAGSVQIAGPATASGSFAFFVGSRKVEVGVASGDTPTAIAAALNTELGKDPDLPVTSAVDGVDDTKLNITAKHKGTLGDQIGLDYESSAAGVTATITAMAGGATDPDVSSALAVVAAGQYHIIATPYNNQTDLTSLTDHLDLVSGPLEQRPGVGVYGMTGTLSEATTLAAGVNHGRVLSAYLRNTRSMPCELASAMAAIMASEEDPARPLNTLELRGIDAPAIDNRLSRTEQENCLYNGVAPVEVGPGENVQVVRAISTYTKDAMGNDDISLLDITTIRTLDYVRKACRERVALRFPREKLSSKTPEKVRSELVDVLVKLEELEIVEQVEENLDSLIVERDLADPNRLDAKIPADVVNGLHVFAGRIDLLL